MPNTTNDYTGRQIDLEMLQRIDAPRSTPKAVSTTVSRMGSAKVTGVQKLAQRWTLLFLTAAGTVRFAEAAGCGMTPAVSGGYVNSRGAVMRYYLSASLDVASQLAAETDDAAFGAAAPLDERLKAATLLEYSVDFSASKLYLKVQLTSQAGDTYVFVVPTA